MYGLSKTPTERRISLKSKMMNAFDYDDKGKQMSYFTLQSTSLEKMTKS